MEEIYIKRLKILARWLLDTSDETLYYDNLGTVYVYAEDNTHFFFEARYFGWALLDLPWMFEEWEYNSMIPIYIDGELWSELPGAPFTGDHIGLHTSHPFNSFTVVSFMKFFGIDLELFLHFFGENDQQPDKYGGDLYPDKHTVEAKNIADNIFCYISKFERYGHI